MTDLTIDQLNVLARISEGGVINPNNYPAGTVWSLVEGGLVRWGGSRYVRTAEGVTWWRAFCRKRKRARP